MRLRDAETGEFIRELSLENAKAAKASERCLCVRRKTIQAQLSVIPPVFGMPRLGRLKPSSAHHHKQAAAIDLVRNKPDESYLFTGRNGSGKSHIAWAIYRHALASRRPAVASSVRDLLDEFRRLELSIKEGDPWTPRVRAIDLRKQGKPWLIFLDEFEKARPSEFASEQLFNLLDAAKSFGHQLVITSNFDAEKLRSHWGRIDEVWGNSIMTRLWDCHRIEFF
jgi:DNA replication protein DnaC